MVQEPPFSAVYFDLPNNDGTTTTPTSRQVYEHSALYRFVGSQYEFPSPAQFFLYHPFTRVRIARNLAWNYVIPVSSTLQDTLHRERLALGLILEDDNPLTVEDHRKYDQTMRNCVDR
jgi:hypothetical protein